MISILCGNEPYNIISQKGKLLPHIEFREFNYREFGCVGEELMEYLSVFPFMEDRKVAIVTCSMSEINEGVFDSLVDSDFAYADTIIILQNVDKRLKLYKKISSYITFCNKLTEDKLRTFIFSLVKEEGGSITDEGMEELLLRINYELDTVNLFMVRNAVLDLVLYNRQITKETVAYIVKNNEQDNAFALIRLLEQVNINGIRHQTDLLNVAGVSAIRTLSLLHREFRIASKVLLFGPEKKKEMGIMYVNVGSKDLGYVKAACNLISKRIREIQTGKLQNSDAVLLTMMEILNLKKGV